ncbi:hypothetical protein PspLS_01832 [Pyricularia sp. CBS 133598]|nr:hypothetical protein PspLS_01832 [Pyricularia sp. CBS 133598]
MVLEALKQYDAKKFTDAQRLKLEAELLKMMPPQTITKKSPKDVAKKPVIDKKTRDKYFKLAMNETRTGDRTRIHVVNEKLCDDVLEYIPSLERHKGCDIVDLYPGTGVFSQKLNDLLQPRSHILLEPEPQIYQRFLEPILARPGSRLVPKSGIIWQELNTILTPEFLPHQEIQEHTPDQPPRRNDTLLVVANLGFFPNKPYMKFKSVVSMVMYQLITAVRLRSLFQKYGLVRVLLWVRPPEVDQILPKSLLKRRRPALEGEFLTEYIAEICTSEERMTHNPGVNRNQSIEVHSCGNVLDRMHKLGLEIPDGRETSKYMSQVIKARDAGEELPALAGTPEPKKSPRGKATAEKSPWMERRHSYGQELLEDRRKAEALWFEIQKKQNLAKSENCNPKLLKEIKRLQDTLNSMVKEWNEKFDRLSWGRPGLNRQLDDIRTFTTDPPLLLWDRRPVEPFLVRAEEFYPNVPLSLLDIQPRAPNPLLLENGVGSRRYGDHFQMFLQKLLTQRSRPVAKIVSEMAHGAVEGIGLDNMESFTDPSLGGSVIKGFDAVRPIVMNERQLMDLLTAWMQWPFRPTYEEMATTARDDSEEETEL